MKCRRCDSLMAIGDKTCYSCGKSSGGYDPDVPGASESGKGIERVCTVMGILLGIIACVVVNASKSTGPKGIDVSQAITAGIMVAIFGTLGTILGKVLTAIFGK